MAKKITVVLRHGQTRPDILLDHNATNSEHKAVTAALRNVKKHRSYQWIGIFESRKIKQFNRATGQDIDSSSSNSSSSSSSSSSTAASVTSSSSSGHSSSSSSSSSSPATSSSSSSS